MGILLISLLAEEGVSTLTMVLRLILTCLMTSWGGRFFYLTRPLLIREVLRKSSPVPFFTLKEGAPPLPRLPLLRRGLQPVNRLFCTRKQAHAPKGVARDYLRNRVAIVYAPRAPMRNKMQRELRLSMRRGRPCGIRCNESCDCFTQ